MKAKNYPNFSAEQKTYRSAGYVILDFNTNFKNGFYIGFSENYQPVTQDQFWNAWKLCKYHSFLIQEKNGFYSGFAFVNDDEVYSIETEIGLRLEAPYFSEKESTKQKHIEWKYYHQLWCVKLKGKGVLSKDDGSLEYEWKKKQEDYK